MFQKGGIFGIGPGHGSVKSQLPDVHADFLFSFAGEELGVIFLLCRGCYVWFFSLSGFSHAAQKCDVFDKLCISGSVFFLGHTCLLPWQLAQI